MTLRIDAERSIGNVLFIVEGAKTEFSLLKRVFSGVLGYSYIEKRRNNSRVLRLLSPAKKHSKISVINTEQSHISYALDPNGYLDSIFETLIEDHNFPVDQASIYYLFDRDPASHGSTMVESLIESLQDPFVNQDSTRGLLLLSYPSIESYVISNFVQSSFDHFAASGKQLKARIGNDRLMQLNRMSKDTVLHAAYDLLSYLTDERVPYDVDDFGPANMDIFANQERSYSNNGSFRVLSLLTIALLQLGVIRESSNINDRSPGTDSLL